MSLKYKTIRVDWETLEKLYKNKPQKKNEYITKVDKVFSPISSNLGEIKHYKDFQKTEEILATETDNDDEVGFYILFVPMQALKNHFFYMALGNSKYRRYDKKEFNDEYNPKPIIFITAFKIFKDFHTNDFKKQSNDFTERLEYFTIDKRVGFLDSSVWHFYLPYENYKFYKDNNNVVCFENRLSHAVYVIKEAKKINLYEALVSKENLEFQVRLMKNSYLDDISGDHSKYITPFVFHSEGEMYHRTNYEITFLIDKYKISKSNSMTWNILLLDDYATETLKRTDFTTKEKILNKIKKEFEKVSKNSISFEIKCLNKNDDKDYIEAFLESADDDQYDIVLLDYLLDDKNQENNKRALGSDLFTNPIYRSSLENKNKGVLGKYWFLPISSFNKAMLDKISNEGINRVSENWFLFDGADIVTTPELFKYHLIKLMELQLNQALVTEEEIIDMLLESDFKNDSKSIRAKARGMYGTFMHRFGLREYLKLDASNNSAFATSIIALQENEKFKKASEFYEYVRKALYLTGYGTHSDKETVWELLKTIEKLLPIDKDKGEIYKEKELESFFSSLINYLNEK